MAERYKFKSKGRGVKTLEEMGYGVISGCVIPSELPESWPNHLEPSVYKIPFPVATISETGLLKWRISSNWILREKRGELESALDDYFSKNGH